MAAPGGTPSRNAAKAARRDAEAVRTPARVLLGGVGTRAASSYLVRAAGAGPRGHRPLAGGPWLPVILALETARSASDFAPLRAILGERLAARSRRRAWLRSSVFAYAMMILVPPGAQRARSRARRCCSLHPRRPAGRHRRAPSCRRPTSSANGPASPRSDVGGRGSVAAAYIALALLLAGQRGLPGALLRGLSRSSGTRAIGRGLDRCVAAWCRGAIAATPTRGLRSSPNVGSRREAAAEGLRTASCCGHAAAVRCSQYAIVLHAVGGASRHAARRRPRHPPGRRHAGRPRAQSAGRHGRRLPGVRR